MIRIVTLLLCTAVFIASAHAAPPGNARGHVINRYRVMKGGPGRPGSAPGASALRHARTKRRPTAKTFRGRTKARKLGRYPRRTTKKKMMNKHRASQRSQRAGKPDLDLARTHVGVLSALNDGMALMRAQRGGGE